MFDISKVLKRAWHILWNYRILWIFGFILAVTAGGMAASGRNNFTWQGSRTDWQGWPRYFQYDLERLWGQTPTQVLNLVITVLVVAGVVILLSVIVNTILRYVAETASIRMVDEYEQTSTKVGFRQGWKYGWSPAAWRLFLINLLVYIPVYILLVLLGLIGLWIYFAVTSGVESAIISSSIAGAGLAFLFIFLTVLVMAVMIVIRHFAWRVSILEGAGVMDSLRRGFEMAKRNWQNIGLTWLVMLGLGIGWGIVAFILFFPLAIVCLFTALAGVIVAALPTLAATGLASLFTPFPWYWVIGGIVGLPLFFLVAAAPLNLVGGWAQIFSSSVWTVTYRELKALEAVTPEATPQKTK